MNLLGLDLNNFHSHVLQNLSSFLTIMNVIHEFTQTTFSRDEPGDYLLIFNFLINYIDESCIT